MLFVMLFLVIAEFVAPLLAIIYLNRIYYTPSALSNKFIFKGKEYGNKFYVVSAVFTLILLILYITPDSFLDFFSQREMDYFSTQLDANNSQIQLFIDALKETRLNIFICLRKDFITSSLIQLNAQALPSTGFMMDSQR